MKALSLEIIKGRIDQVEQVVFIDWVQPRVLDKNQVETMRQRVSEWRVKVTTLAKELKV
jgi:26S proteasome regulatory subunit N9